MFHRGTRAPPSPSTSDRNFLACRVRPQRVRSPAFLHLKAHHRRMVGHLLHPPREDDRTVSRHFVTSWDEVAHSGASNSERPRSRAIRRSPQEASSLWKAWTKRTLFSSPSPLFFRFIGRRYSGLVFGQEVLLNHRNG